MSEANQSCHPLQRARLFKGLTQQELADKIGVEVRTLRRWEHGEAIPRPFYRIKLRDFFQMSDEELGLVHSSHLVSPTPDDLAKELSGQNKDVLDEREQSALKGQELASSVLKGEEVNRQRFLSQVRSFWIEGILEDSLHGAPLIVLGLQKRPEAVSTPWRLVIQLPTRPVEPLPAGTSISTLFDQANGELLILGDPGSGKTTLLLELTRELLDRAASKETHLLPAVFHLSSWATKRFPLEDWLSEELSARYHVPPHLAKQWIKDDQILPLLDGLDEVKLSVQGACVEAINAYRHRHGLVPMVVCCRSTNYSLYSERLVLTTAIEIEPLTIQQIEQYLLGADEHSWALRESLQAGRPLHELAKSPLMLNLLMLTHKDEALETFQSNGVPGHQQRVFKEYVQHMLQRRGIHCRYSSEQVEHWISWLAHQLVQHQQTEFSLERMQACWLPAPVQTLYHRLVTGLLSVLVCGMVGGIAGGLISGLIIAHLIGQVDDVHVILKMGLPIGIVLGMLAGGIFWLLNRREVTIRPVETLRLAWTTLRRDVGSSVITGLLAAVFFSQLASRIALSMSPSADFLLFWLCEELTCALAGGLIFSLIHVRRRGRSKRKSIWRLSGAKATMRNGMLAGLIIGLMETVLEGKTGGMFTDMALTPFGGFLHTFAGQVSTGLVSGLLGGMIFGGIRSFSHAELEKQKRIKPNQGIQNSAKNALVTMLVVWFIFVSLFVLASDLHFKWIYATVFGHLLGCVFGLFNGGIAYIEHWMLRCFLWRSGCIPWNYSRFLDFATERILLRKVGGRYFFIHRLLLEHLASRTLRSSPEKPEVQRRGQRKKGDGA